MSITHVEDPYINVLGTILLTTVTSHSHSMGGFEKIILICGDALLSPVRRFIDGRDVEVLERIVLDRVDSRKANDVYNLQSIQDSESVYDKDNCLKTACLIVLFIPGLILGLIFKGICYGALSEGKKELFLLQNHFRKQTITIGAAEKNLLLTKGQVMQELKGLVDSNPYNQSIRMLKIFNREPLDESNIRGALPAFTIDAIEMYAFGLPNIDNFSDSDEEL